MFSYHSKKNYCIFIASHVDVKVVLLQEYGQSFWEPQFLFVSSLSSVVTNFKGAFGCALIHNGWNILVNGQFHFKVFEMDWNSVTVFGGIVFPCHKSPKPYQCQSKILMWGEKQYRKDNCFLISLLPQMHM